MNGIPVLQERTARNEILGTRGELEELTPLTISQNPNRSNQAARDVFVDQIAAEDTTRLHCFIPSELHQRIKVMAVDARGRWADSWTCCLPVRTW